MLLLETNDSLHCLAKGQIQQGELLRIETSHCKDCFKEAKHLLDKCPGWLCQVWTDTELTKLVRFGWKEVVTSSGELSI